MAASPIGFTRPMSMAPIANYESTLEVWASLGSTIGDTKYMVSLKVKMLSRS